jgi:hypothetical protein
VAVDKHDVPRIVEGSIVEGSIVEGSIVADTPDKTQDSLPSLVGGSKALEGLPPLTRAPGVGALDGLPPLGETPTSAVSGAGKAPGIGGRRTALAGLPRTSQPIWRPASVASAPRKVARRRRPRWRLVVALALVLLVAIALPLIDGPAGARGADALRATLGPRVTAQLESDYFNAVDALQRARAHLFGAPKSPPWAAPRGTPLPTGVRARGPRQPGLPVVMDLPHVQPILSPALPGEGEWSTDGLPAPTYGPWPAPMAKTYVRPDPSRPYAVVMLVAIDLRQVKLHIVDGTSQPASGGTGAVPAADRAGNLLLAAFNGGYKAADGHYGLMTGGHTYLPARQNAATLALYADGSVRLGAWGSPAIPTTNLVAYRQNGTLLLANGAINPSAATDGYAWGAPILANIYTWRSALALTSSGVLLYAAGNSISADTLAQTLLRAGAAQAMQLDINPVWVRFDVYSHSGSALVAHKLRTDMSGDQAQFLSPYARDFLYVTRAEPVGWPQPVATSGVG